MLLIQQNVKEWQKNKIQSSRYSSTRFPQLRFPGAVAQIFLCHPELDSGSHNLLILLDAETSSA